MSRPPPTTHRPAPLFPSPTLSRAQPGARARPPVPAPAGDAAVVAPHHLAGLGGLDHGLAAGGGLETLAAVGDDQPRRSGIGGEVLAADRDSVAQAERVVYVDHGVDRRQPALLQHPLAQRVDRARPAGRLPAARLVALGPGRPAGHGPFPSANA